MRARIGILILGLALGICVPAGAQPQVTTAPASDIPDGAETLTAEVVEVKGLVQRAVVPDEDTDPDMVQWLPVSAGEKLAGGTQIRTGLRAHLILRFGDNSVVMIRRSTLASIDEFYRQAKTETVRLSLGYGAVRGGTTEGEVTSDFIVDSAVATLAKRGTEGWEFWVEPYTGRFRVSLAESGLVEALQKLTGQRRLVRPGEYANHLNIGAMWIQQDIFDRTVQFFAADSLTATEWDFFAKHPGGLAVTGAAGRSRGATGRAGRPPTPGAQGPSFRGGQLLDTLVFRPTFVQRPEGNFGMPPTFDLLVPRSQAKAFRRAGRLHPWARRQVGRWVLNRRVR
jgi:hypothetical protein